MPKLMKSVVLLMSAFAFISCSKNDIKIPNGKMIAVDGKFSESEWNDAYVFKVSEVTNIYFKQSEDNLLMCLKSDKKFEGWVHVWLNGNVDELTELYSKVALEERTFQNPAWPQEWDASHSGWEATIASSQEVVKEFKISRSRFKLSQWKIRFWIYRKFGPFFSDDEEKTIPENTSDKSSDGWMVLEF